MNFLEKIHDDNRGISISIYGTGLILVTVICLCSVFDYWVLTYAKTYVISKLESYELSSLAKYVDLTDDQFLPSRDTYADEPSGITIAQRDVVELFHTYFEDGLAKEDGLIKDIKLEAEPTCYNNYGMETGTFKIFLNSGPVSYRVDKLLKSANGTIPFIGGKTDNYDNEKVRSSVITCVKIIF